MFCFKCGCELTRSGKCPNCGADVVKYKKIIYTSNYLYNEGLEKASVRDLTGAVYCLKQSLWYWKENLDARNLLGLVYYEMGETVAALSEWVIGKNINDERVHQPKNPGERYLAEVQNNRQIMENINVSIERYNLAIDCCSQNNLDVAILQLKKVLQLNSRYLRARQLLSLLYLKSGQLSRAEKELDRCLKIDVGNTTTLRYRQELEELKRERQAGRSKAQAAAEEEGRDTSPEKKTRFRRTIKYTRDNETIIQPVGLTIPGVDGFGIPPMLTGSLIGFLIAAAILMFLVMPARLQKVRAQANDQVRSVSEELSGANSQITQLQKQIEDMNAAAQAGEEEDPAAPDLTKANPLMAAAASFIQDREDIDPIAESMSEIYAPTAVQGQSEEFAKLYNVLYPKVRASLLQKFVNEGIAAYEQSSPDYPLAIKKLELAIEYESLDGYGATYDKRLYYLANAYYQMYLRADTLSQKDMGNYLSKSMSYCNELLEKFPNSAYRQSAQQRIDEIRQITQSSISG